MVFFSYLFRIFREFPLLVVGISALMAMVAITEGLVIALVVPLLTSAFGTQLPGHSSEGSLAYATSLIGSFLEMLGFSLTLGTILGVIIIIFILQGFVRLFQKYLQWKTIERYEFSLIHRIFQNYVQSSWSFFIKHKLGYLLNILTAETYRAVTAFKFVLQSVAQAFLIAFYLIISLAISWRITLLGVVLGFIASMFLKTFIGKMERYGAEVSINNTLFHALALDLLSAIKMVKSSATENQALSHLDALTAEKTRLTYASQMNGSVIPSFYFPLVMSMLAFITYVATLYWELNLALLLVFLYIFYRLIPALSAFHSDYQQALIFIPALDEIDFILKESSRLRENGGTKKFKALQKSIAFDRVSLAYTKDDWVLNDISLTIPKGSTIAIAGISGAGKTSIADLLLGLFSPSRGSILIDGIPLSQYRLSSWRKGVGYMSQDIFLLNESIRKNLLWIAGKADEKNINRALRAAHAYEFIMRLPEKLDTIVGDRGVKLSGGQRQRLALARLLLQDPDIIILDEAMSALDAQSEALIQKALRTKLKGKTKIIISHRLASIRDADMIYVLEKGRITEKGTWDELVSNKGLFSKLQREQSI